MASEVKTNKVSPSTGTDVTLGDASDTFTIPASVTLDVNGTIDITGATQTGFPSSGFTRLYEAPSGTYTVPADVTKIVVQCQGAGGSGSSLATYYTGGGGGGFVQGSLTVVAGHTMTVAVGAGGVAIGAGGGAGNAGGDTTFTALSGHAGFTAFSAGGGAGGISSGAGPTAGGAVSGGDFRLRGGRTTLRTHSGQSFWSVGPIDKSENGADFGYGKGSGAGTDGSYVSGTGGPGLCLIWEYK
jgi:hypothetical protein